ncbi:hypothetical protein N7532_002537 [Penicillium argentinense]|uniref:Protein transport protein sec16 n=1 Tax=Penicillium argentinense TaxID=1131581 RepID=A0A9W9KLM1_9EURO|nr:uncharacterized protein N7532_002537 [Penicillium argentinense]KAJ5109892.1 hypothetical protein N7532_002537 [Penicillium argentinense]
MAQTAPPLDQVMDSWNPALRPEDQSHATVTTSSDGELADPLAGGNAKEHPAPNVKSPLSDDDFSAWDMPHETGPIQSIDTTVEASALDAPPTQGAVGTDNVPDVTAITDAGLDEKPADPEIAEAPQDPFSQGAEPAQPPGPPVDATLITDVQGVVPAATSDDSENTQQAAAEQTATSEQVSESSEPQPSETVESVEPVEPVEITPPSTEAPAVSERASNEHEAAVPDPVTPAAPYADISTAEPVVASEVTFEAPGEPEFTLNNAEGAQGKTEGVQSSGAPFFTNESQDDPSASFFDDIQGLQNQTDQTPGPWDALDDKDGGAQPVSDVPVQPTENTQPGPQTATDESKAVDSEDAWDKNVDVDVDSDGDDFFNQLKTQTKPIFGPPETESRFEEGVPLLDEATTPTSPERPKSQEAAVADPFGNDEDDAEGFFSSVQDTEASNEPASLHIMRKSTSQVMESVGFHIDSPASDISAAAQLDSVLNAASSDALASQGQPEATEPSEEELAARWEAELSDIGEDDMAARWEAALSDDDGDMLLEEDVQAPTAGQQVVPQAGVPPAANAGPTGLNSPFETLQSQARPRPIPGVYTPHQPTTADLVGGLPLPGAPPQANQAMQSYFSQQPSNPVANRGESFTEKSKQGYKSPYDLPEDLSRPRRPVATHKPVPPRVENMPPPPSQSVQQPVGPPPMSAAAPTVAPPSAAPVAPAPAPKNFFEELPPPPPKSRPASSGRYTPGPAAAAPPPAGLSPAPAPPPNSYAAPPPAAPTNVAPVQSSLQPPELLGPYASSLASSAPAGPPAASRYSPKPPGSSGSAKPPSRYSPAPPAAAAAAGRNRYASQPLSVPGQQTSLPFQPRTSSPLAYHEKVSYQPEESQQQMPAPSLQPSVNFSPPRQRPSIDQGSPYAPQPPSGPVSALTPDAASPPAVPQQGPPYAPPEYINEFAKRVAPSPTHAAPPPGSTYTQMGPPPVPSMAGPISPQAADPQFATPRRSQTQSPGQQVTSPRYVPSIEPPLPRPASVHGSGSPTKTSNPYAPTQPSVSTRARALSQRLDFIAPVDGQEQDSLERWKGAPIFKFGFGGAVVSCFPKHIPRYSVGQTAPMIKPTLGDPKFSQLTEWLPPADTIVQHPGPLKTKSKKKDVIAWLSSKIAAFENETSPDFDYSNPDSQKRHEEKILLWKITKILVENDGVLEGSPAIQQSLRQAIFPNLPAAGSDGSYGGTFATSGSLMPLGQPPQGDAADPRYMEELRNDLLMGEREKAVWSAVDRRLWGHALIVSSTMDKSVWKQVVQEFIRREVKSTTANAESLAALYEIFAGNVDESIDELVPPSARAGHHLISKVDGQGSAKNALDGLDSWRDTLGLVLSNRSSEDHQALLALGRLLASYGRIEAAHICFMFSRGAVFGGADDPQANIVLLGADHHRFLCTLLDEDAILLTEVYEFATSVLANSPVANLSYLLAFKLLHAKHLADRGRKTEAQNYCDSVAASLKATTRPSPYHHQYLFIEVDELSARLRQTTTDGGSSWISKPSMEKVSGSMWARFNSFVAGDESDAASTGSGKAGETADVGPFANVAGTPTVSRSPSVSDLYGSYPGAGAQPVPAGSASRYMPTANQYAPNASPEQFRGRSSMDSQRSTSFGGGLSYGQRRSSQDQPSSPADTQSFQGVPMYGSPGSTGYQPTPSQSSYVPLAPVEETSATQSPADVAPPAQSALNGLFYQPPGQDASTAGQSPYYQGPPGMPQAESNGYMPPASSANSYEPPSYAPAINTEPQEVEEPTEEPSLKPKKSFMDDEGDDDLAAKAAALQKAENDRKADEAFRKAAEEDAKKDAKQQPKKGWFGGWFGGGKKEADNHSGGGPIKAKLGEENSFYYDKELKKWVNKKDPGSAEPVRATPPPPRGSAPPSRTASNSSMPPPPVPPMPVGSGSRPPSSSSDMPPSLSSSPAFSGLGVPPPMGSSLPRSVSTGAAVPTPPGSSSGPPPPRPSSSLTHANSIDDLLGAPTARKGNTVRGKKKGRYVDVMAK